MTEKQDKAHLKMKLYKDGLLLYQEVFVLSEKRKHSTRTELGISFELKLTKIERDRAYDYEKEMGFGEPEDEGVAKCPACGTEMVDRHKHFKTQGLEGPYVMTRYFCPTCKEAVREVVT